MTDGDLRQGLQQQLLKWLDKLSCSGDVEKQLEYKQGFVAGLKKSPIAIETDVANEQHYEVPTEFFETVLGPRLKYSSCIYEGPNQSLEVAEEAALSLICKRAKLQDGQVVMDLGCGWGATALWICENYPSCKVVCVSNSFSQGEYISKKAYIQGFGDRLRFVKADMREFSTSERFDRIISIEMFEHMKNYELLMEKVASWLKPEGLLFTQILCHRQFAYNFKSDRNSDTEWMSRYFFSGGTMPSSDLFLYFQKDLAIEGHWNLNGNHYSKTLEAWLKKLDENVEKVRAIFRSVYGEDACDQQIDNWRMFFIYCSEVFSCKNGNEWIVAHHLFKKIRSSKL